MMLMNEEFEKHLKINVSFKITLGRDVDLLLNCLSQRSFLVGLRGPYVY